MNEYHEFIDDKDELLRRMNERYVVVLAWLSSRSSYSRCVVFDLEFQIGIPFAELRKRYLHIRLEAGETIANWWLNHPDRRQVNLREDLPGA